MRFTMLHDIYSTRTQKDDEGNFYEEDFIVKGDVKSDIWLDETKITLVVPQYSKKGRKYPNRVIISSEGESYVLNHSFDDMMKVIDTQSKTIGFKAK